MPKLTEHRAIAKHSHKRYDDVEWYHVQCTPPGSSCPLNDRKMTSLVPDRLTHLIQSSRKAYPTCMEMDDGRKSLYRTGEERAMRAVHVPSSSGSTTYSVYMHHGKVAIVLMPLAHYSPARSL